MTKKDYEVFAEMFRTYTGPDGEGCGVYTCPEVLGLAKETAKVFQRDNSSFDRARFLKACGARPEDY